MKFVFNFLFEFRAAVNGGFKNYSSIQAPRDGVSSALQSYTKSGKVIQIGGWFKRFIYFSIIKNQKTVPLY